MFLEDAKPLELLRKTSQIPTPQKPTLPRGFLPSPYLRQQRQFFWKTSPSSMRSLKTTYLKFSPLPWGQAKAAISVSSGSVCPLSEMGWRSSGTFLLPRKAHEAARRRACANLTWKASEQQQHWPWKFWQWSLLIFCFIMSSLRVRHWQYPTTHSLGHAPLLPGASMAALTLANTHHLSYAERIQGEAGSDS